MRPVSFHLLALCLVLAGWLHPPPARADTLYVGETVMAADEAVTDAALARALDEVLMRLSGQDPELLRAHIGAVTPNVRALLLSHHRVRVPALGRDGAEIEQLRLRAEFDPQAVDRLLREHQIPRWGRERPDILLWASIEVDRQAQILDWPALEWKLNDLARRHGLELLRPLGDALDMAEVSVADIRGGFLDSTLAGLERYRADLPLMLDLRQRDEYWTGRWLWRLDGQDHGFELSADDAFEAIEIGMSRMAAALASRFAVRLAEQGQWQRLVITGLRHPVQYAELIAHLERLDGVEQLRLLRADGERLYLDLLVIAANLDDVIGLGGLLVFEGRDAGGGQVYRLAR